MATEVRLKNTGLRGVKVADTKISYIDGENGILIYRGYRIEELAESATFMEIAHLLLEGTLPTKAQLAQFNRQALAARQIPEFIHDTFRRLPPTAAPMDVLQATVPLLGLADPELALETKEANLRKAIRLIARLPAVVAAWHRLRNGCEPLPVDDTLSHATNTAARSAAYFSLSMRGRQRLSETVPCSLLCVRI